MSYNNPTYRQVMEHGISKHKEHFCKSYHQLARIAFMKRYNIKPNLEDSQAILDIFEEEWGSHYDRYDNEREDGRYAAVFYKLLVPHRIDVKRAALEFLGVETLFPFLEIVKSGRMDAFKQYAMDHKDALRHNLGHSR
jgi:hypothetical protein